MTPNIHFHKVLAVPKVCKDMSAHRHMYVHKGTDLGGARQEGLRLPSSD